MQASSGQEELDLQLTQMVERRLASMEAPVQIQARQGTRTKQDKQSRLGVQECCICTIVVGSDEATKRRADKLKQAGRGDRWEEVFYWDSFVSFSMCVVF